MTAPTQIPCYHPESIVGLVVADAYPVMLKGIEAMLAAEAGFDVQASCSTAADTLAAVRQHQPQLLLLDLHLPFAMQVILYVSSIDEAQLHQAIQLGVRGMLLKTLPAPLLVQCLHKVKNGGDWLERPRWKICCVNKPR